MDNELIQLTNKKIFESPYIKEIIDCSDDFSILDGLLELPGFEFVQQTIKQTFMARLRIIFFNNYQLSVIRGRGSFGGDQ